VFARFGRIDRSTGEPPGALRSDDTEGAFEPEVDRVPAGHSVAPGGRPAPIPGPPRGPAEDPRGSRRHDRAAADPAVVAAVDAGVGPRGRPCRTRRPTRAIRLPPRPRGDRAHVGWGAGLRPMGPKQEPDRARAAGPIPFRIADI
jgi:hypothetical protein